MSASFRIGSTAPSAVGSVGMQKSSLVSMPAVDTEMGTSSRCPTSESSSCQSASRGAGPHPGAASGAFGTATIWPVRTDALPKSSAANSIALPIGLPSGRFG